MRYQSLHHRATRILASQVHASAGDAEPRHRRFLALAAGAAGLSWLALSARMMQSPALLDERLVTGSVADQGTPLVWTIGAFVPFALAVFVSRTGKLRLGHLLATAAAAALTSVLAVQGEPSSVAAAALFGFLAARVPPRAEPSATPDLTPADLVTRHAVDGTTLDANAAAQAITGISRADLMGRGFLSHVHVQDRVVFLKTLDDAVADGTRTTCELRLIVATATRWVRMNCIAEAGGIICISRDVTDERERSEALERRVEDAEAASRSKSDLVTVASHELRTPLNAIIGFSDLLRSLDGEASPLPYARRREYADLIHGAGAHLLAVVNDLLDMSRLEAGRYELRVERADLCGIVRDVLSMLSAIAEARGVRLVDIADRSLPPIEADPRACRQMLINLVANALDVAPAGSTVTVGVTVRGTTAALRVCDRGTGMCASDIERLGRPFTQFGDKAEGSGLGLSIVKGLVELHDGTFEVRSVRAPARGHGTEIVLTIPTRHTIRDWESTDAPRVVALPVRDQAALAEEPSNRSIEYGRVSA